MKLRIIEAVDHSGKFEIARKYDIPKSTFSMILKNKGKVQDACCQAWKLYHRPIANANSSAQRNNRSAISVAQACTQLLITGPILEEKAKEIASQTGFDNFHFSDGWLSRYKKRPSLVFKTVSGKSAAVNRVACSHWQQGRLQEILKTYNARDVFNTNEMELLYKALPAKTHLQEVNMHC